jgi:hypothetical protein
MKRAPVLTCENVILIFYLPRKRFTKTMILDSMLNTFPDDLWVLAFPGSRTHYGIKYNDDWGLVCFAREEIAQLFLLALRMEKPDLEQPCMPEHISFDTCRELAKSKGEECRALYLMDDAGLSIEVNCIHYVR